MDDLPTDGVLETVGRVIDIMDKKSGAVVTTSCESFDQKGRLLVRNQSSTFLVGCGNFGGKKDPSSEVIPAVPTPTRKPDATLRLATSTNQAAVFRLSGDLNPLHIDPSFSAVAGFKQPILHGLCTLGETHKGLNSHTQSLKDKIQKDYYFFKLNLLEYERKNKCLKFR